MVVERTFSPPMGEGQAEEDIAVLSDGILLDTDAEGVVIQFGEEAPEDILAKVGHYDNLAEHMDEGELTTIGANVIDMYRADRRSRAKWERSYRKGLKLLGLEIEEPVEPFEGACGVFHPLLTESIVRFQSHATMETFPPSGPVKSKIIGKQTNERHKQAARITEDMNYISTEVMPEYRDEHERLLVNLPLAGSAFKKVWFDHDRMRPVAEFVSAEDVVVSYGSTNISECGRLTHVMREPETVILRRIISGFYRDIGDLSAPEPEYSENDQAVDKVSGESPAIEHDDRHMILEMQLDLTLCGAFDDETGIAKPFIVTVMMDGQVLSLRRNWSEGDETAARRQHFTHYTYLPGLGFYGIGLIHLIGGLARASTSILRQLVDAGTFSNIPAGFKAKGFRVKGQDTPFRPGEWRDVDVPGDKIRDALMPLPYKEPSTVLAALLQSISEEGRRLGSISDVDINAGGKDSPVGTTLALMERSLKVMSAVQSRLHKSMATELKLLAGMITEFMPAEYPFETDPGATRTADYDGRVDVIPVSDPNASTMAQKVIQYQAAQQAAATAPNIYDMKKLHRGMLDVLQIKDAADIIPMDDDMKPRDPVTENMAILKQEPVKVFDHQDHKSHIAAHMMAMKDPLILEIVGQSPNASAIQAAAAAHVTEHVAYQYRRNIEEALGTPLPSMEENLPPDVEASLSPLIAQAANKVLKQGLQDAEDKKNKENLDDPLIQIQMRELAVKEAKQKDEEATNREKLRLENKRIESAERIAGGKIGAGIVTDDKDRDTKEKLAGVKHGIDIMENKGKREDKRAELRDRRNNQGPSGQNE